MVIGIAFLVIGYALFYWGWHHFPTTPLSPAENPKYPLSCVLGISGFGLPSLQGLRFAQTPEGQPEPVSGTAGEGVVAGGEAAIGSVPSNKTGSLDKPSATWPQDILAELATGTGRPVPQSKNNIKKLIDWNACEGNNPMPNGSGLPINNPFNTTYACCGGVNVPSNSAGVKQYPDWTSGIQATAATLGMPFARAILANLQNDGSHGAFAQAVGSSGWGTNGSCIASR